MEYRELLSLGQVEQLLEVSKSKAVVIFKHSTRCVVSHMAWHRIERGWDLQEEADLYYLDILGNRELSTEISRIFKVRHESPQVLVIRDGHCIYDTSHNAIFPGLIAEKVVVDG